MLLHAQIDKIVLTANIHSAEVTSGVAACYLIHYLLNGYKNGIQQICEALATRTFYVVPRVNPDGVEVALNPVPSYPRSGTKPWPHRDGYRAPGLYKEDIDKDGRILNMRIKDPHGSWVEHPSDPRVMIPFDHVESPYQQWLNNTPVVNASLPQRYRILREGIIENYDGFTIPTPYTTSKLDFNRNYPALWGKEVSGSGDHALSEPEIDCLVRALSSRPNVCGYNTYHTNGGFLIFGPSCIPPGKELSHIDVWVWKEV
jgi:murein tripeptide amidase MpaA